MDEHNPVDPEDGTTESSVPTEAVSQRVCVVGALANDDSVMAAAKGFGLPVQTSETGMELLEENSSGGTVVFILEDAVGPLSEIPHHSSFRLLGHVALLELSEKGEGLPPNTRPLYSHAMSGLVVCFTGFRKKDQLMRLVRLVQFMGGSIRKEMSSRVTHLIAHTCGGDKYQYALTFRVPVMSQEWVLSAWEKRKELNFRATSPDFMCGLKLKPFHGARICFMGFPDSEKKHMEEVLVVNGGIAADMADCSHIVVESGEAYSLLKAKMVPTSDNVPQHSKVPEPHPVPPQRRKSSFLSFLLSPNKCPAIREEEGPGSPQTPDPRPVLSSSPNNSAYLTPKLSFFPVNASDEISHFSNLKQLPTSTPINTAMGHAVEDHSFEEMVTAETWDLVDNRTAIDDMCPLSPDGQTQLCEGTGDISLINKPCAKDSSCDAPPTLEPSFSLPTAAEDTMLCDQEEPATNVLVVDEVVAPDIPQSAAARAYVVKAEWFWVSVQNEGCADEKDYLFEEYVEGVMSPSASRDSLGTPTSSRLRKRKRLRDAASRLVPLDSPAVHKRRSSVSDAGLLSMSGSFLDCSSVSDKVSPDEVESASVKSLSPRQQVFLELVQTETNYVGILHTIMTLIKAPLEEMSEEEGPLLDNTELKTIFGHLPPIYELHSRMLQELCWANAHWADTTSIGNILLKYAPDMVKAYPPFVNFFEQTKEMLYKCDQAKPRFHAFLKVCQNKPECGRQTLGELLIRPVQRLPSISLLLGDILKHTNKNSPDHTALEAALRAIREVMTHINEDKRRMEACIDMFSIFNDIDNCPPHIVSSHRAFVTRCDVVELSNELSGRGDGLVFFLFSDILEVCKKRSKAAGSLKSPNTATLRSTKHFKHVRLIPLSDIKRVFDVQDREGDSEETQNIFALKCRSNQELKEKLYSFTLADDDVDKLAFLQTLCRQLANTVCKADAAYFLAPLDYGELDVGSSEAGFGTLSKAFKLASRTKLKIGRTFSFNKTPSKLKRAVSTMMSPFGSTTNLTPSSQLAQMRLASCTNLNELAPPSEPDSLKPPMSVQPRRKNSKSSSLSMASFRRL